MPGSFLETHRHSVAVPSQALGSPSIVGTYAQFPNCRRLTCIMAIDEVLRGSTITVRLLQATDSSGTGAKALGSAVTVTVPTDGASPTTSIAYTAAVEARIEELDQANSYTFIAAQIDCSVAGTVGAAIWIESVMRHDPTNQS